MAYIRFYASASGKLILSVDYLVKHFGYKINRKENKINSNIVDSLVWLKNKGYISYDIDLSIQSNQSECFTCIINDDNNIFDVNTSYVKLYESEFDKIINCTSFNKKHWLLTVYLHIKKRINLSYMADTDPYFYSSLTTLQKECSVNTNISIMSVSRTIEALVSIGLLHEHITGKYIVDNQVKSAVNVYCIDEDKMDHEVCDSIVKNLIKQHEDIEIDRFIKAS